MVCRGYSFFSQVGFCEDVFYCRYDLWANLCRVNSVELFEDVEPTEEFIALKGRPVTVFSLKVILLSTD